MSKLQGCEKQIVCGDAYEALKQMPSEIISCVMTSFPYWGQRDYKVKGQMGLEKHYSEWLEKAWLIMDEVWRVLRKDGTCWINLGDKYGGSNSRASFGGRAGFGTPREGVFKHGSEKSLLFIPERFAIGCLDRGWTVPNKNIWHKPNPMPSSGKGRFTNTYEFLYFMVKNTKPLFFINTATRKMLEKKPLKHKQQINRDWKWKDEQKRKRITLWRSEDYFFDLDAVRRPHKEASFERIKHPLKAETMYADHPGYHKQDRSDHTWLDPAGKNPGDTFSIPEESPDLSELAFKIESFTVGIEVFNDLFNFISVIVDQLKDSSRAMFLDSPDPDAEAIRKVATNRFEGCFHSAPHQPNFIYLFGCPYTTITIQKTPDEITFIFGSHWWKIKLEGFSKTNTEQSKATCHSFAINLNSISRPFPFFFFFFNDWTTGFPSSLNEFSEFQVFRNEADSCTRSDVVHHNTPISRHQPKYISHLRRPSSKIEFVQAMLGLLCGSFIHNGSSSKYNTIEIDLWQEQNASFFMIDPTDFWSIPTQPSKLPHYASYPEKLCETPLKAGCPRWICKECGMARCRVTKPSEEYAKHLGNWTKKDVDSLEVGHTKTKPTLTAQYHTLGWSFCSCLCPACGEADCKCGEKWRPGIVEDPFCGIGTTLIVAKKLGLWYHGIDLKPEYCEMAEKRLKDVKYQEVFAL